MIERVNARLNMYICCIGVTDIEKKTAAWLVGGCLQKCSTLSTKKCCDVTEGRVILYGLADIELLNCYLFMPLFIWRDRS